MAGKLHWQYSFSTLLLFVSTQQLQCCETQMVQKTFFPPSDMLKNVFIGALSGAASMAAYTPCSYFQNRYIQKKSIEWTKPHHWFRGYCVLACNNAPVIAIQQVVYHHIKNTIQKRKQTELLSHSEKTLAVTCAGGLSGPVNNCAQLIALHQQNTGLSVSETINRMPEQYKSLRRASVPAMYRGMFFANSYMNCFPYIKENIGQHIHNTLATILISGFISSLFITATSQPLQVIITTLHADIEKKQYKGMRDAYKKIIAKHGVKGLYYGGFYRTIGNACALPVLESIQKNLRYYSN